MIGPEQVVSEQMRERRRTGAIWLAVALILAITLGVAYKGDQRAEAQDEKLTSSDKQVETLTGQVQVNGLLAESAKEAADEANRRLKAAGKPTVPVPTVTPVGPASPAPVVHSLTIEDVRAVVAVELAQQKVTITQAEISQIARTAAALVPKPADGKTPSTAEIQRVVEVGIATYCLEGRCTPKPGVDGKPGKDGANGRDAPEVTDEELLNAAQTALAALCAQENQPCKGKDGTDGKQGEPGRGITSTACLESGRWLVRYSDGSTETVDGPCRVDASPTDR